MARLLWSEAAAEDLECIFEYLAEFSPVSARHRIADIKSSVELLQHSPSMGRPIANNCRQLIIGKRHAAYIAIYRYDQVNDIVYILHVRSERSIPDKS